MTLRDFEIEAELRGIWPRVIVYVRSGHWLSVNLEDDLCLTLTRDDRSRFLNCSLLEELHGDDLKDDLSLLCDLIRSSAIIQCYVPCLSRKAGRRMTGMISSPYIQAEVISKKSDWSSYAVFIRRSGAIMAMKRYSFPELPFLTEAA